MEFTRCPICEEKIDLEVTYPELEVVGHFLNDHTDLLTGEQTKHSYWEKYEYGEENFE